MVSQAEIASSVYGAFRLARMDPAGLNYFNRTVDGAARSFWAAVLLLPAFALIQWFDFNDRIALLAEDGPVAVSTLRFAVVEAIAYVVGWTAFPVVMLSIVQLLDRVPRYFDFLVVYNWSSVVQVAAVLPLILLSEAVTDPLGQPDLLIAILGLIVQAMLLAYQWFYTKAVLAIGGGVAALLVAADFILSLTIQISADRLAFMGS